MPVLRGIYADDPDAIDEDSNEGGYWEGFTGPTGLADTAPYPLRLDRTGAFVGTDGHGRYYEAVSRGNVYFACNQISGANVAPLGGTTIQPLALLNPKNSGVLAVLIYVGWVETSDSTSGQTIWVVGTTNPQDSDGTNLIRSSVTGIGQSALLGSAGSSFHTNPGGKVQMYTGGTLPSVPKGFALLGAVENLAITTQTPGLLPFYREFSGSLAFSPGTWVTLQTVSGTGQGTADFIWEEVPL